MDTRKLKVFESDYKEFSDNENTIVHYITTANPDREGDIVLPEGMNDANYSKNPVVLFNHNTYYVIGKSLWRNKTDKGILSKTKFAKTDFANDIKNLHKEGVLNAWSIGFMVNKDLGSLKRTEQGGYLFDEWELLEYSSVSIPANPEALDVAKTIIKSIEAKDMIEYAELNLHYNKLKEDFKTLFEKTLEYERRYLGLEEIVQKLKDDNYLLEQGLLEIKEELEAIKNQKLQKQKLMEKVGSFNTDDFIREIVTRAFSQLNHTKYDKL